MGMWPVDKAWVPVAAEAFSATRPTVDGEGHSRKEERQRERGGGERETKVERENEDKRYTETKISRRRDA